MKKDLRKKMILAAGLLVGISCSAATAQDRFERPGVTADKASGEIRIQAAGAQRTGDVPVEFLLIGPASGHAYEAIAVSSAKPSDIHAALEFIGLQPGRPCDSMRLQFWPEGPTVIACVRRADAAAGTTNDFPLESCVLDTQTRQPPAAEGFYFTGSARVPGLGPNGTEAYAADEMDPGSILPLFNLAGTVLDIPRMGGQGALYGRYAPNPDRAIAANQAVEIILRAAKDSDHLRPCVCVPVRVIHENGKILYRRAPAPGKTGDAEATRQIWAAAASNEMVYAQIEFAPDFPCGKLRAAAETIESWVESDLLRIRAPAGQQLFYRAFKPDPSFRSRTERPAHPLELTLVKKEGAWSGIITAVIRERDSLTDEPVFRTESWAAATPEEAQRIFAEHGKILPVALVTAPADATYADLCAWLCPLRTTHPVVHVFVE